MFNSDSLRVTYKASTVVTESRLQVGGLLKVVRKAQAQLGIDGAGPHEVGCDLIPADEAFPAANDRQGGEYGQGGFQPLDLTFPPVLPVAASSSFSSSLGRRIAGTGGEAV